MFYEFLKLLSQDPLDLYFARWAPVIVEQVNYERFAGSDGSYVGENMIGRIFQLDVCRLGRKSDDFRKGLRFS